MHLLQVATNDNFFTAMGEKLTLIAALGFFLWYFMKELKSERLQNEVIRKSYEDKIDKLIDKQSEMQIKTLEAISKTLESNDSILNVLEDLKEIMLKK